MTKIATGRNPYLILGVPYGASRAEANAAFVRRARRTRRGAASAELTDLTWALHEIDEALKEPAASVEHYRVPADPAPYAVSGTGLFTPGPERLAARPGDREVALRELRQAAAAQYLRVLVLKRAAGLPPPSP